MNPSTAVIELHYMPSIPYLAAWNHFSEILIESKESFIKQTYRNRCRILTANKVDNLIVPVEKASSNIPVQEIRISYTQDWPLNHWKTIQSAYGNAPYFEFYGERIKKILLKRQRFLFDLNLDALEFLLDSLGLSTVFTYTETFIKKYPQDIFDLRSVIHPKKRLELLGFYSSVEYIQVFGEKFVPDLSAIDLLFNEGPNAKRILNKCLD